MGQRFPWRLRLTHATAVKAQSVDSLAAATAASSTGHRERDRGRRSHERRGQKPPSASPSGRIPPPRSSRCTGQEGPTNCPSFASGDRGRRHPVTATPVRDLSSSCGNHNPGTSHRRRGFWLWNRNSQELLPDRQSHTLMGLPEALA